MFRAVTILGFLSLLGSTQGFESSEGALKFLEDLEQEVEQHLGGVKLLIEDGKERLAREHEREYRKALARSSQGTREVLAKAAQRQCGQDVVAKLTGSLADRWSECMNLTEKLVEYERIAYEIYDDYLQLRPQVCAAANNMMLCFKKNVFVRMSCFYDSVMSYMGQFSKIKDMVMNVVHEVNQLAAKTLEDFKGCFESKEANIRLQQQELLEQLCPLRQNRFRI